MYYLAFYFSLAFLCFCCLCSKHMSNISRILIMLHYNNVATSKALFVSYICNRFCNIFNALTSYCKQNVAILKVLGTFHFFNIHMRNTSIKPSIVCGIDFSIPNARDTFR